MLIEAILMSGAAIVTSVVGVPIAVRLARAEIPGFGKTRKADPRERRDADITSGFTPLDLGPDPMKWPSAGAWPSSSRLPDADWPSKSWDDEHFGRHWRDGSHQETADGGFHAMLARTTASIAANEGNTPKGAQQRQARRQTPAPPPQAENAFFEGGSEGWAPEPSQSAAIKRSQERVRREAQAKQQEAIRQQAAKQAQQQARQRAQQQAAKPPAPTPARSPRPQATGQQSGPQPPSRKELEAMVASEGLAGTVQHIMRRTGWDFRKAAQHLARARAGQ